MLSFLRTHQRLILVFTAFVMVGMVFFGASGNRNFGKPMEDPVIGKTIDGGSVTSSKLRMVKFFLADGDGVTRDSYPSAVVGTLNGHFVQKELFEPHLIDLFFVRFNTHFEEELGAKVEKIQKFKPYAHPSLPYISASHLWTQFAPKATKALAEVGKKESHFEELCALYREQSGVSVQFIRNMIDYQQKQVGQPDPRLNHADLSICGMHSLEEWFGSAFMETLAKFVLNGAALAQENGYKIKRDEAWAEIVQNVKMTLEAEGQKEVSTSDAAQQALERVEMLGLSHEQAVEAYTPIALFKRFLNDAGGTPFFDVALKNQFNTFSSEKRVCEEYALPEVLQCRTIEDVMKQQIYFDLVDSTKIARQSQLDLPSRFASLKEIEKRAPMLVSREVTLGVKKYDLKSLSEKVSLKDVLNWEVDEKNWSTLVSQFPSLKGKKGAKSEERYSAIESVDGGVRFQIDEFATKQLIAAHPEWQEELASAAVEEELVIHLKKSGSDIPLQMTKEQKELFNNHVFDLVTNSSEKAQEALVQFDGGNDMVYHVRLQKADEKPALLSLDKALKDGTLDTLLTEKLERGYTAFKKQGATQLKDQEGNMRDFAEVRQEVGYLSFEALFDSIVQDHLKNGNRKTWEGETPSYAFLATHRYDKYLREQKALVSANLTGSNEAIYPVVKTEKTYARSDLPATERDDLFSLEKGAYSNLHFGTGNAHFCRLVSEEYPTKKTIYFDQSLLSRESKKHVMNCLITEIEGKEPLAW